jgi:hypothetical protein
MQSVYYIGLDAHKKAISSCVKDGGHREMRWSSLHPKSALPEAGRRGMLQQMEQVR